MAAVAEIQTVSIAVNGIELAVPKGELLVEAVKRIGIDIPIFCYHSRLKPVGMCRMCLVEVGTKMPDGTVRMAPKPQAACTLPCTDGMVVLTDSESIHRDRRGVLEFLLINHPLDCPICDRGGECPLQNNTLFYGPSTSRYIEIKRHALKAFPLSKHVTLDLERCIQCGRCVRFTEEISGDAQLAFRFRGAAMQPSTFEMTDFDSKFSGNVIEICPVGALTSSQYRFRARPWDLETSPAICTLCSNGCNIWMDHRVGKIVRINGRTNEEVNEEWTCDKGKFGHDFYNETTRLESAFVRSERGLAQADWGEALSSVAKYFQTEPSTTAGIAGTANSNEDLFLFKNLFETTFGSKSVTADVPFLDGYVAGELSDLASWEMVEQAFVFGTSLAEALPMFFLRLRKGWFNHGTKVIVAHDSPTDADSFADCLLRYAPGSAEALLGGLNGDESLVKVAALTGISEAQLQKAQEMLKGQATPVLTTRSALAGLPGGLSNLARLGATIHAYAESANGQGAVDLGLGQPFESVNEILKRCVSGEIKALWLMGCDPVATHFDRELAKRALETVPFLVFQGIEMCESARYASVILPQTAPVEAVGTYTSAERRVQLFNGPIKAKGIAKPGWQIISELMQRILPGAALYQSADVFDQIAQSVPAFSGLSQAGLTSEGTRLK